jgi:hypothetical protein
MGVIQVNMDVPGGNRPETAAERCSIQRDQFLARDVPIQTVNRGLGQVGGDRERLFISETPPHQ